MIIQKSKLFRDRLRRARVIGNIISIFPYVKCVILTGSLAEGHASQNSDIDILIITRAGRIFTARFFVNVFGMIFGIKRSKDETKNHAGKFCFNYFLADNYLMLPVRRGETMDRYCAKNYSQSKFIAGDKSLYQEFLEKNRKLFDKYGFLSQKSKLKSQNDNSKVKIIRTRTNWFEQWVKLYQIKKIESDPITKKYPDLIVYNDKELRFHPPKSKQQK